jgi:tetratricopeptide (TPR) repeat protein
MSDINFDETKPIDVNGNTQPSEPVKLKRTPKPKKERKPLRWLAVIGGVLILLIITAGGVWLGYNNGIQARVNKYKSQVALRAVTYYQLGLKDQAEGRYEAARTKFEYVIQLDPKFPGAVEKLTEVMMTVATRSVPTPVPIPTAVPTRDMRGVQDIYNSIQNLMKNQDWDNAILSIDALRKNDSTFHAVDLDGMYYEALRQRGVKKIMNGSLELGIYDLALAERFGPLDKDADSYRNWARYYMTGASYWELDWTQVLDAFSQIYPYMPNLRDGSNYTAAERYRIAAIRLGETAVVNEDWCKGRDYYKLAMSVVDDSKIAPTATRVAYICNPPPTPTKKSKHPTEVSQDQPASDNTAEPSPSETPQP